MKVCILVTLISCYLVACAPKSQFADTIFSNGTILTMNDAQPSVDAVAVKDGKIIYAGTIDSAMTFKGDQTEMVDLNGRTLMPGLIDVHSHFTMGGTSKFYVPLQPSPYGTVNDFASLKKRLRDYIDENHIPEGDTIIGNGYDDAIMTEQLQPTKETLDSVSDKHVIYIWHTSGHMGVANSKALAALGINKNTPNKPGGVIVKNPEGTPTGLLQENENIYALTSLVRPPKIEPLIDSMMAMQKEYLKYGQTTICDGRSMPSDLKILHALADMKLLKVDVIAWPDYDSNAVNIENLSKQKAYHNRFRIGGMKFSVDGSPQGRTAWLTQHYYNVGPGHDTSYKGVNIYNSDSLYKYVKSVLQHGMTFQCHDNGDAAIDQMISTVQRLKQEGVYNDSMRGALIHVQVSRPDHVAKIKAAGLIPSYYVSHTYFWGDWHRKVTLGQDRAAIISPCKQALDSGLIFTLSHDAPITPPDIITLFATSVTRATRSGFVLGPELRLKTNDALKAVTINAAYQIKEEKTKGSIENGKLADLIILDKNPLTTADSLLHSLVVQETYKEGKKVYDVKEGKSKDVSMNR